ncbi:hypothetical protein [Polaribacter dokdonensis]|uniref:hypothetical protein n=1 Tax=Polaribacter dokdonensis TaxID=326329 RepID=UPI00115F9C13|nr:hypothetical protein [Polaribacter dokdonensis]
MIIRFPLVENVIWTLVIVLIVVIVVLVIYLKVLRNDIRNIEAKKIQYTAKIEQLLVKYLYLEEHQENYCKDQKDIIDTFKIGVKNSRKRRIINYTFLKLSQQISGNMINIMRELYDEIGLFKFAVNKLKSRNWNIIALGIRDLRQFEVKKVSNLVEKFVNHNKEEVRREAHLYFLELFEFEGLNFLDNLKLPLSEWDQIELLLEIEKFDNQNILEVDKWLKSDNIYVILFILNIVKIFNKLETKNILLELIFHKNEVVRLKTLDVVIHFEIIEAKDLLINNYDKLSLKEKVLLFKLLEKVATQNDVPFLLNYITDTNFEIKSKALFILRKIDETVYENLEKVLEDVDYNRIIKFLDYQYGV